MRKCYQCDKEANEEHSIPIEMYDNFDNITHIIYFCNDCWQEDQLYVECMESYEDSDLESFM